MMGARRGIDVGSLGRLGLGLGVMLGGGSALADVIYSNTFESGPVGTEWSDTTRGELGGEFSSFLGRFDQAAVRLTLGTDDANNGGPDAGDVTNGGYAEPFNGSRSGRDARDGNPGGGLMNGANPIRAFGDRPGGGGGGGGTLEPGVYNLTFDLYLFDSWDGLDRQFGEDRFEVVANGVTIFDEALETFEPWENALGGWTRPEANVYAGWARDLIYREISLDFMLDAEGVIEIDFIGKQNQILIDESWGIDNVTVRAGAGRGAAVPSAPTAGVLLLGLAGVSRRRR